MSKIEPIRIPSEVEEMAAGLPAETVMGFLLQRANIRTANALTAMAIHSGAMTPEGEFISSTEIPPIGTLEMMKEAAGLSEELKSAEESVEVDGDNQGHGEN